MPSVADEERVADLHDAVEALKKASSIPAKQRVVKVSGVIDVICRHAFDEGLDSEVLRAVIQIAVRKTELDQTSVTTLVKNLYPAQLVPADVVVDIVAALGQGRGKPSPSTQNSLVKWLVVVHEIIDDHNTLSRLYGVLFGMLDTISIRTPICHLLSLITRRKHVKPFRIQQILELSRGLSNEPALQGLLRIYKDYYPEILLGSEAIGRNSFPPQPDPEWRARLLTIQEANVASQDSTAEQNGFKVMRKGAKRSKLAAIPDVHTFHATEASVTLEGIDSVDDFVGKLDRIEPPGQMISFLTDPLLQKYVELNPSPITTKRIHLWLATCLEEGYNAAKLGTEDTRYMSEVLDGVLRQTHYTKSLLPVVLEFLKHYLLVWDGTANVDTILGLVSYIPIQPFRDANAIYLTHLETALSRSPASLGKLINFYTDLLRQWMNCTVPKPSERAQMALSTPEKQALHDLVLHVSEVSTSLLLSLPPAAGASMVSSVLSFYELLASSSKPFGVPIILPPMHLVSFLVLEPSTTTVSRICGIIGKFKTAFDQHPKPVSAYYPRDVTDAFNWCLRDVYNLFWISRALLAVPDKSFGLYCKPALRDSLTSYLGGIDREYAVATAFGLSTNSWLASLAAATWRSMEEEEVEQQGYDRSAINWHKGPVSQRSLDVLRRTGGVDVQWDTYKVNVLFWLEARGCAGVKDLMFATATELKNMN
ncbi:Mis6-domain-containing protein [Corynespora cassiicola Philippines]|uniref:Mis6-domain-containing protein n=1 Tax=Corynespora cassiicola Philippines TaxID=1448308 RepID=A0A2T2NRT9_CORCC|nr:Mis6-domain-containing protein [Corynespora cassiicola Philippines]